MPWTTEDLKRLVELEAHQQGVDPRLAQAVVSQESEWNPNATGDNGRSIGLFQLQEAAAKDAGLHPRFRSDPADNIKAGITYLKQKLTQSGGNVEQALSRYNRGTPDYRGIGDPNYVQNVLRYYPDYQPQAAPKPGILARIGQALSPASAEAASAAPATGGSRLQELEAELARRDAQQPAQATTPAPPTATSTPEQDAAYRASVGQQEPVTAPQTAPAPTTQPGASQGPSGARLSLGDPGEAASETEARATIAQMRQRQAQPSPGDLSALAVGGGPSQQAQPVTDPAALLAGGKGAPSDEQRVLAEARARQQRGERQAIPLPPLPTVEQETIQESLTAPSTMIPLLMPGAGIKAVAPLLSKAGPLITRGARAAAEGLSQTAGWTAGRTAETGQVPSPGEIGTEAALNVATGGLVEIPAALRGAKNAVLRRTPGAQTLLNQQAVQEAEGLGKRVFNAQDKAVVSKAFDSVAATGEQLDITPVRKLWQSLTPAEQRIAGAELNKISSTFAGSLKTPTSTWDIGELQHLRSELGKASATKRTPETIDLLHSLRSSVDDAIHNGMARGSLPAAELVEAQKAWRKVMQAEDLQGLVTRHTKDSPNLKWQELNLAALNKEIRGGGKKSSQRLVAGMDPTERQVLQQELDALQRHYPFIRITPTAANVVNLASLVHAGGRVMSGDIGGAMLSLAPIIATAAISSPAIMSMFKRSIIEGRGQLSSHSIDALLNAIRHENEQPPGTVRATPTGTPQ